MTYEIVKDDKPSNEKEGLFLSIISYFLEVPTVVSHEDEEDNEEVDILSFQIDQQTEKDKDTDKAENIDEEEQSEASPANVDANKIIT